MDTAVAVDAPAAALPVAAPAVAAGIGQASLGELLERAGALQAGGRAAEAAGLYESWLQHNRAAPLAHVASFNRATLLSVLGREQAAEAAYAHTLDTVPGFAPALLNLGHLLERRGDTDAALGRWASVFSSGAATALEHRLHALNNSARLLEQLRRYPQAEALMRQSLELKAEQPDVVQHFVHIRQKQCAWPADAPVGDVTPNQRLLGTSLLATMGLTDDPALQLLAAVRFVHAKVPGAPPEPLWRRMPARSGRVRIGYLSGDLHLHAVGLLIPELLELHDRRRVEVFGFCWTPESETPQRRRILAALDHHVRLAGVDDATAARLVAEAGIDVLVDLQGLTSGARPAILGMRPAPVQVSYLGLPGTSALPGVDWMLVDNFLMPPALEPYCTERPIRLPHCWQVSDRRRDVAAEPDRAACGLPADGFVYASFNNNHKFTADMFSAWMRILGAVPGSVLWLLADNDSARDNMRRHAQDHGIAPERLVFAPRVAPPAYLARFACADLVLDTSPYNAGTTASDALWMGTPLVTLAGRSVISRMAGSLLHAVGLPDLVTDSLPAYEALAVLLGLQPARTASLKRYLAEHGRQSRLFDMPRLVGEIDDAFERLALAARGMAT